MSPERQLRILQIACIVVLLTAITVSLMVQGTTHGSALIQGIVSVLALSSAVQGFTAQRQIVKGPSPSQPRSRLSTPFSRWRAGNLVRLASATAVGLWALILSENGGPALLVNALFVVGMLLLLIWRPGASPDSTGT